MARRFVYSGFAIAVYPVVLFSSGPTRAGESEQPTSVVSVALRASVGGFSRSRVEDLPDRTERSFHRSPLAELGAEFYAMRLGPTDLHGQGALGVALAQNDAVRFAPSWRMQGLLGAPYACGAKRYDAYWVSARTRRYAYSYVDTTPCLVGLAAGGGSLPAILTEDSSIGGSHYLDAGFGLDWGAKSVNYVTFAKVLGPGWGVIFSRRGIPGPGSPASFTADVGLFSSLETDREAAVNTTRSAVWINIGVSWGWVVAAPGGQ